jgi:hypothetical protein
MLASAIRRRIQSSQGLFFFGPGPDRLRGAWTIARFPAYSDVGIEGAIENRRHSGGGPSPGGVPVGAWQRPAAVPLMVRIDPDKVTPRKSEAQSKDYLSKPAKKGD